VADPTFDHAQAIYDQIGMGNLVGLGARPGVLVVDFTYGFTDPDSPIGCDMSDAVESTAQLLDVARDVPCPVFYTINGFRRDLQDAGVWPRKFPPIRHLVLGTRWTEIDARIAPEPDDVVLVKQYPSAFFGTSLASMLNAQRLDSLVLAGATTSGCVRASAVDALQHGYRVVVAAECVADRHDAPHRANLFDLHAKYADVVGLDEVCKSLADRSGKAPRE
jgi:maleamate amidohydrolase